MKKEKEQV